MDGFEVYFGSGTNEFYFVVAGAEYGCVKAQELKIEVDIKWRQLNAAAVCFAAAWVFTGVVLQKDEGFIAFDWLRLFSGIGSVWIWHACNGIGVAAHEEGTNDRGGIEKTGRKATNDQGESKAESKESDGVMESAKSEEKREDVGNINEAVHTGKQLANRGLKINRNTRSMACGCIRKSDEAFECEEYSAAIYWAVLGWMNGECPTDDRAYQVAEMWKAMECPMGGEILHPGFGERQNMLGQSLLRYYGNVELSRALADLTWLARSGLTEARKFMERL